MALLITCSICLLGFASSADNPATSPGASHSVIVFENVESSVVTLDEDKGETCNLKIKTVSMDPCHYQLGSVGGTSTCFNMPCETDWCCVGSCPDGGDEETFKS